MKKVSIIVPVFNSEKYLSRCIESILNQTYDNIELILINDGSTDTSGSTCDSYAANDSRVRVVHQANSGVSAARNAGIHVATGDYFQFVDSDDYIDANMTAIMAAALEKNAASVAICGYKRIDPLTGQCMQKISSEQEGFYSHDEMLGIFDDLYLRWLINIAWNKMYLARIIKDNSLAFEKDIDPAEDIFFNLGVIKKGNGFEIISECLYNYVIYDYGSTLSSKIRPNVYEIHKLLLETIMSLYEASPADSSQIHKLEMDYTRGLMTRIILQLAVLQNWENYRSYLEKAREIRADVVLIKSINGLETKSGQERLIKFLMRNNMFLAIFMFARIKRYFRTRIPAIFGVLRRWGGDRSK